MKNGRQQFPVRQVDVPRTFAGRAYVLQLEPGLFGIFRDVLVETDRIDGSGNMGREKAGRIGPLALLREAREGDPVVVETDHPEGSGTLRLTPIDPEENG